MLPICLIQPCIVRVVAYFPRNEAKVFYFEGPLKGVWLVLHVVFFSWKNKNMDERFGASRAISLW